MPLTIPLQDMESGQTLPCTSQGAFTKMGTTLRLQNTEQKTPLTKQEKPLFEHPSYHFT